MHEKPFVCVFSSPNRKYCFDVNTNQTFEISESFYDVLNEWLLEDKIPEEEWFKSKEYLELKEKGYLSAWKPQELEHPVSQYLNTFINRNCELLVLQITQACNFRCKYCTYTSAVEGVQRKHTCEHMSWDIARKAIDYFVEKYIDVSLPEISFYGGEPLLAFELLKKTVLYAEQKFAGRGLGFNTTVNGSLLNEDNCQFFQEHNFKLLVSLDGSKDNHDKNRVFASNGKGTFDVVISKLQMLATKFPELAKRVSINMVVDSTADDIVFDLSENYPDIFPTIAVRGTFEDTVYRENENHSKEEQRLTRRYVLQETLAMFRLFGYPVEKIAYITQIQKERELSKIFSDKTYSKLPQIMCPSGPCVPGSSRLFVTCDGHLFPCERVSETCEYLCLGTIETGINESKAYRILNIAKETENVCKNCFAIRHCGVCVRGCTDENGFSIQEKEKMCRQAKNYFKSLLMERVLLLEAEELYGKKIVW